MFLEDEKNTCLINEYLGLFDVCLTQSPILWFFTPIPKYHILYINVIYKC